MSFHSKQWKQNGSFVTVIALAFLPLIESEVKLRVNLVKRWNTWGSSVVFRAINGADSQVFKMFFTRGIILSCGSCHVSSFFEERCVIASILVFLQSI